MKKYTWLFVAAIITLSLAFCRQNIEPERPVIKANGLYHAVYVSPSDSMPININLDVKQVTDSTFQAQMAFYHYYKDNLLYSEVTEPCEPVINGDTIHLNFLLSKGIMEGVVLPKDRYLNVTLLYSGDSLKLLSSSDDEILPNDVHLLYKAVTYQDSAAIRLDEVLPRMTMLDGMYFINGPIKKFSVSSSTHANDFEYYFDENGIVTGYKDAYGKMQNYEVGEIYDGSYYSFFRRNGGRIELTYNTFNQLVSDNTKLSLISYYFDHYGRLTDGYFKNSRSFYAFALERDAHGTLVGILNKYSDKYAMKYIVREIDNYGNPLEQSIDYCNGRVTAIHCRYEYYE